VIDVAFTVQDDVPVLAGTRVRCATKPGRDRYLQLADGPGPDTPAARGAVSRSATPRPRWTGRAAGGSSRFQGLDRPR